MNSKKTGILEPILTLYHSLYLYCIFVDYQHTASSFMEFTIDYLNTIIENLSNEPSVNVATTNKNSSSTTVKTEPFVLNEEQTLITATNHGSSTTVKNEPSIANEEETLTEANNPTDRQYCLIIFNNARWSERLRKKSAKVIE